MKTHLRRRLERGVTAGVSKGEQPSGGGWRMVDGKERMMEENGKECVLAGEGVERSDLFTFEVARSSLAHSNTRTHIRLKLFYSLKRCHSQLNDRPLGKDLDLPLTQ